MNTTFERPEEDLAVIEIELSKKEWELALTQAKAAIPGESEEQAVEAAVQAQANQALADVITNEKLKLISQPTILSKADEDGGMTISINCEIIPDVELGQYTGLNVKVEPASLTEEEIDQEVMRQLAQQQSWKTMPSDYAAKLGDRVIIDFVGEKDGVPFEGGTGKNYPLLLGSGTFIPGFEDQLVGIKAGESRDVNVTFPENYMEASLAGQPVVFHCTAEAVEQEVRPELTDAFIESLGHSAIKTVEQLRERVKTEMTAIQSQENEAKAISEILDKIIADSVIKVPDVLVKTQLEQHLAQYEQSLQQIGMGLDQYLAMTQQSLEELETAMTPVAIKDVQAALVLETIAEQENLEATQEEMGAEYEILSRAYNMPAAQLQAFIPPQAVASQIVQRKAIDFLKQKNIQ